MQAATQQTPFLCPTHTIKRTRMHTKRKNSIKCIPPLLAPAAPHPTFAAISLHGHAGSSSVGGVDAQHPCVEMHRHSWNIKQLAANLHSLEETKCVCVCVCVCLSVFLCTHTHTHTRPLSLSLSLSLLLALHLVQFSRLCNASRCRTALFPSWMAQRCSDAPASDTAPANAFIPSDCTPRKRERMSAQRKAKERKGRKESGGASTRVCRQTCARNHKQNSVSQHLAVVCAHDPGNKLIHKCARNALLLEKRLEIALCVLKQVHVLKHLLNGRKRRVYVLGNM